MNPNTRVVWVLGDAEFDPSARELRVGGQHVRLERKPMAVLERLLEQPGEVVTKEELLESVWHGRVVVEAVLTTAITKLRSALRDHDQQLVTTVHGYGYRLTDQLAAKTTAKPVSDQLDLAEGSAIAGRPGWVMVGCLGEGGFGAVWLARERTTHQTRVFKFSAPGPALTFLKREITLNRTLLTAYPNAQTFPRLLGWNLAEPPFFAEFDYGGLTLRKWASQAGGLSAIDLETRVRIAADVATALSQAHDVGVLHCDLKPDNILCAGSVDALQIQIADFGSGHIQIWPGLADGITRMGFTQHGEPEQSDSGSLVYMAPERLAGSAPTVAADIYSLGVILFQLVTADFNRPFAPGWEALVNDELLREDIAEAAQTDPSLRTASAIALATALRTLPHRRAMRQAESDQRKRDQILKDRLARSQARAPWLAGVAASACFALIASSWGYWSAREARRHAQAEAESAKAVLQFLTSDLFPLADPEAGGRNDITLATAVARILPLVEKRFSGQPHIEAVVRREMGRFLNGLMNLDAAADQFRRSAALARQSFGEGDPRTRTARVVLIKHLVESQYLDEAEAEVRALGLDPDDFTSVPPDDPERPELLAAYATRFHNLNRCAEAISAIDALKQIADKQTIDDQASIEASCLVRIGDSDRALAVGLDSVERRRALFGDDHPRTLFAQINYAQSLEDVGKPDQAVTALREMQTRVAQRFGTKEKIYVHFLNALGRVLNSAGHASEAVAVLGQAEEILAERADKDDEELRLVVSLHLAQALSSSGAHREAVRKLDSVPLEPDSSNSRTAAIVALGHMSLAIVLEREGRDFDTALREINKSLELIGDRPELDETKVVALLHKSSVLHSLGDVASARETFRAAIDLVDSGRFQGNVISGLQGHVDEVKAKLFGVQPVADL